MTSVDQGIFAVAVAVGEDTTQRHAARGRHASAGLAAGQRPVIRHLFGHAMLDPESVDLTNPSHVAALEEWAAERDLTIARWRTATPRQRRARRVRRTAAASAGDDGPPPGPDDRRTMPPIRHLFATEHIGGER